jgi:hypothetical protein
MSRYGTHSMYLVVGAAIVGAAGCLGPGGMLGNDQGGGGDGDPLVVGTINVTTTTTGASPDPDGYMASLDEARVEPIGLNGAVTFSPIPIGTYGVLLSGVDGTCTIVGDNPLFVTVKADSIVTSHFDVTCP